MTTQRIVLRILLGLFLVVLSHYAIKYAHARDLGARADDDQPKYFMVLTVVMPAHMPDVMQKFASDTLDECWAEAKEAVQHGVPKRLAQQGAIAVMAGCLSRDVAEDDL